MNDVLINKIQSIQRCVALAEQLTNMIHFRNIIVHQYKDLDLEIVKSVIDIGLDDLIIFGDLILKHSGNIRV